MCFGHSSVRSLIYMCIDIQFQSCDKQKAFRLVAPQSRQLDRNLRLRHPHHMHFPFPEQNGAVICPMQDNSHGITGVPEWYDGIARNHDKRSPLRPIGSPSVANGLFPSRMASPGSPTT